MHLLALEFSTATSGVALFDGETLLSARAWTEGPGRRRQAAAVVRALLSAAGLEPSDLAAAATGLGPGSFTGVRSAVSLVTGLTLPSGKPVIGISSAAALAWRTAPDPAAEVVVVGDARRERLWLVRCAGGEPVGDHRLIRADELPALLAARPARVVTPDWDRLQPLLEALAAAGSDVVAGPRLPDAEAVGRLALRRMAEGGPGPAATPAPIYLHPPVFIEPRYPAPAAPG